MAPSSDSTSSSPRAPSSIFKTPEPKSSAYARVSPGSAARLCLIQARLRLAARTDRSIDAGQPCFTPRRIDMPPCLCPPLSNCDGG
eukprot:2516613-Pyramimonas_sp.AAC.1